MKNFFRKILISLIFNSSLLLMLIIGIQNSTKKAKVNLIINETVTLPISFFIGVSFISGSITGSFLSFNLNNKNKFLP